MCGSKIVILLIRQRFCRNFCVGNFADFWPINFWPTSSPELNLQDYVVWNELNHSTIRTSHPSVDLFEQGLREEWDNMSEDIKNCGVFRLRVTDVVDNEGGYIE